MEEQRPPKRLRSVARDQDGHPQEPGHSGVEERGRGRQQGRSRRIERGRRRWAGLLRDSGLHRDPGLQAGPGHLPGPDLHAEFDHGEDLAHHVEPDARQTPSFPFTGAVTVPTYALQGHSPYTASLGVGLQGLPGASGYWVLVASAVCPHIGFRPSAGSALFFMPTSSGTYVCGVPAFFTHTAR